MIRIIHTADWHLGQTFYGYDRESEHRHFMRWLTDTIEERQADALLVSGDVFDVANPSAAATKLFYQFVADAKRRLPQLQIVVTAGNHDSASRLEAPQALLDAMDTHLIGTVSKTPEGEVDADRMIVKLRGKSGRTEALCMAVPYLRQGDCPDAETTSESVGRLYAEVTRRAFGQLGEGQAVVAMGHLSLTGAQLADKLVGGLEGVDAGCFDRRIAYVALGHIHRAQRVGDNAAVRYAGSPIPLSFAEKDYRHSVRLVEIDNGRLTAGESIECPQLTSLISVPPQPMLPAEVLALLERLPEAAGADADNAPFLEVNVRFDEPDPFFRNSVEKAIAGKHVRLARIELARAAATPTGEPADAKAASLSPLEMFRSVFERRNGCSPSAEMERMFSAVVDEVTSGTEQDAEKS